MDLRSLSVVHVRHWFSFISIDFHWRSPNFMDIHWFVIGVHHHWFSSNLIDWVSLVCIDVYWFSASFVDFRRFHGCSVFLMNSVDVHWCGLIFYLFAWIAIDVHWFVIVVHCFSCVSVIFINCFVIFMDSLMFMDAHWFSLIYIDVRSFLLMFIDFHHWILLSLIDFHICY